jgi:hypothetical protein
MPVPSPKQRWQPSPDLYQLSLWPSYFLIHSLHIGPVYPCAHVQLWPPRQALAEQGLTLLSCPGDKSIQNPPSGLHPGSMTPPSQIALYGHSKHGLPLPETLSGW